MISCLTALFRDATPEAHTLALQSSLIVGFGGALIFLAWLLYRSEEAE